MPNNTNALTVQAERLQRWVIERALPYWVDAAIDPQGGFYEYLNLDGRPAKDAVRRARVQARQIYVYAHAHKLNWYPDGQNIALRCFEFLRDKAYRPDGQPGFIHLLGPDYAVHDARRDLYDHAFYLLAAIHMGEAGQDMTDSIQSFIKTSLTSPYGGWREGVPDSLNNLPRRQNPHMHLFEAALTGYQFTGDKAWLLNWADPIYALFSKHFFRPHDHSIAEFFKDDWGHLPAPNGDIVEPGHAAEWVWLLWQYQRLTGKDTSSYADALYSRTLKGRPAFLYDEEDIHGHIMRSTGRLWVQTELIKAHLAQAERAASATASGPVKIGAANMAAAAIEGLFQHYLKPDGTWMDQIGADGKPMATTIPTSTFYHIFCMSAEANRISVTLNNFE